MAMGSEFAHSTSELAKNAPDDPWATAALSRDSSQDAWMISYIDMLMVLTTLLVFLLAWQKNIVEKNVTAAKATQAVDLSQTSTPRQPPLLSHNACPAPDMPVPEQATTRAPKPPQESPPQPQTATMQEVSPAAPRAQMDAPSAVPTPESTTEVGKGAGEKVAAVAEPRTESKDSTVPWNPPGFLKDQVEITREAKHIRLEIKDILLFESGSADLKAQATTVLESLIGLLQHHAGRIVVEGHTDDRPIATARYPSNWELSAARASTVARYLIMHGIAADRVQAVGYADTRPRSANDSTEGRTRNRRVTLVMYPHP
jgi:chemotaxis protein MotB